MFYAVDDEHIHGTFRRLELKPELFLQRCEERRRVRIWRRDIDTWRGLPALLGGEVQLELPVARQSRAIEDHPSRLPQHRREERQREPAEADHARAAHDVARHDA